MERKFGFPDDVAGPAPSRQAAYGRLFGETQSVSHELIPQVPHINVHTCRRKQGRKVRVLACCWWDERPADYEAMGAEQEPRRVELIFYCYCAEPRDDYIKALWWLPHFPHDSKSWLGSGYNDAKQESTEPFVRAPDWMRYCLCRRASRRTGRCLTN